MSDVSTLETRLSDALEAGTAGAWSGEDLAAAARSRAGARRRRRVRGAVVSTALVAGLGTALVVDGDPGLPEVAPVADDAPPLTGQPDPPSGWHPEEWGGVRVDVPNTWGDGALSSWCERGPLLGTPVVERPGDARAGSPCSDPALGYGVQFLGPRRDEQVFTHPVRPPRPAEESTYPKGSWIGVACGGCEVAVRVVATDEYIGRYVLRSYEP